MGASVHGRRGAEWRVVWARAQHEEGPENMKEVEWFPGAVSVLSILALSAPLLSQEEMDLGGRACSPT